jgi:hypothetical protein
MRLKYLVLTIDVVLALSGCGKKETETPDGCINLSDLETRHDYLLPFALCNDISGIRTAVLNNDTISFPYGGYHEFRENGFYALILSYSDLSQANDTFLFTTITEERKDSEWGIRAWVPFTPGTILPGAGEIELYFPHRYVDSVNVPFIFYVMEAGEVKPVYCGARSMQGGDFFNIKRGVGSVIVPAESFYGLVDFNVGGRQVCASLKKVSGTDIVMTGTLADPEEIPANSIVRIKGNLDITPAGSLTVHEGALILIDEATDINVRGRLVFSGTAENPILITCSRKNRYWGGFIAEGPEGTIEAQYSIFCQSGYHDSDEYAWGHAGRQALFYSENSSLKLDHCFMTDHIGQIFYPVHSTLLLDNILVQRAKTGGQINYSDLALTNSVFTDFPDDSYVFKDEDNDALYLIATDAVIENTVFMYAKDDGLDSGGDEGGDVTVRNCRFEACFHEGAALSSSGTVFKNHLFADCVFFNCGQGLELGFSSPNHTVTAENCLFLRNGTGIRYGDNYTWSDVNGTMLVRNSSSLYNDRDVWNMVRKIWSPKLEKMRFENTIISQFCPQYPLLQVKY